MRSALASGILIAALSPAIVGSAAAHDHKVLRGRLVFADHEKPIVSILDLDTFAVTHRFTVPKANPSLTMVGDGRYAIIKTGDDAGTVRILDTGVVRESHGDHDDIDKNEPKLLPLSLSGERPAHVTPGDGWVSVFFDGPRPWEKRIDARAVFLRLSSLDDEKPALVDWTAPGAQHGIAVPVGQNQWIISAAKPAYVKGDDKTVSSRPDGFNVVERSGKGWKTVASFNEVGDPQRSCKEYHGHAALGSTHLFGCHQKMDGEERSDGGLLVIERARRIWSSRKIAYPDERRSSTVKSREGGRYMVANYGLKGPYNALLRVDSNAKALSTADIFNIPGGQAVCQYEIAPGGAKVANLTPDGKLRVYEVAPQWKEIAVFDAVPAFDCQFGATTPTPSLALVGNNAFVSDPVNRRIREFNLGTLKQGLDAPIDGMPANLAGDGSAG